MSDSRFSRVKMGTNLSLFRGEHAEGGREVLAHLDQLVGVVVERLPVHAEGVVRAGDQRPELLALFGQGLHRFDGVVQDVDEVGRGGLQAAGGVQQRGDRGRAGVGGHDGVELVEHPGQLRAGCQQGAAPVVGGGRDGGQDADTVVFAGPAGRGQDVA